MLEYQRQAGSGEGSGTVRLRHEGLPHNGSDDGVKNLDGVLSRRRDVGSEFEEIRSAIHTPESAGYLVPQFAHADIPLGQVMPTPGLCRVTRLYHLITWGISCFSRRRNRHNHCHRLSRKASNESVGRYRSGVMPLLVPWARACSFSLISACR